ncbi:hypothetical protein BAE44_0010718 [Dichanthelium oligosanthes]|uniref:Uncharacterized protein n=1 Tax=Dichanthelium oligosanthes TaxID=888268 RepID=A0A1E5VT53_9POAL|nr:hypothetical protein BAE44_0010718 [Dichanthelium oligosanthes]
MIFPESFSPPAPPATSSLGHSIQVSFWAAAPPSVSYLCVHCPCATESEDSGFEHEPRLVGAEGRFVLLCVRFADDGELFMYKGDPVSPSLELVPLPHSDGVPQVKEFGIVPPGDDGHYLLVARCLASFKPPFDDELHIYSSVDQTWSIKPLPNAPGAEHTVKDKVITLGEGVLGWVDLRKGVVVRDVLREPFDVRFIPLPPPMPEK